MGNYFLYLHKLGPKLSIYTIAKNFNILEKQLKPGLIDIKKLEMFKIKKEEVEKERHQRGRI